MTSEQRRAIACSTDPNWLREQLGVHQYSPAFCIIMASIGALAAYGIFYAVASI